MQNRMESYYSKHKRELEQTGIVKIALDKFNINSVGSVPGRTLNQFALDEYNNNLRVATTIGDGFSVFSSGESLNDVYVLDNSLNIIGSVKDLGKQKNLFGEIFRDRGYVVTFRQVDPFYVLDLSNPKSTTQRRIKDSGLFILFASIIR